MLELAAELPLVRCNPARLNQVFANLIENAGRALSSGGTLTVRALAAASRDVQIEVIDDGVGLSPERLERVFDAGLTAKGGRVGLRLGLPINRRVVEEVGGRLDLTSTPGEGTCARLVLPAGSRS